jgi:DNA-binding SARP family transcriptional activator
MPIAIRELMRSDEQVAMPRESVAAAGDRCMALVEPGGAVMWSSPGLHTRLRVAGALPTQVTSCCGLLRCAANTGTGEQRCLTRLALADGTGLGPRRWRAADGPDSHEATVSAKVVPAAGGAIVVFDLSFLERDDQPTHPTRVADVEVQALGPLSVHIDGRPMDGDWLQQRPGQIFRYLLASRCGAARSEAIANALWPDRGPGAVANVRYCIYKLREQLDGGDAPANSVIRRTAGGYRVDPQRLTVDVDIFQSKAVAGLEAHRAGQPETADPLLAEALELYRGDFLADDPYAEWAFTEREYLRTLAGKALAARARIALAAGRLEPASAALLRLTQLEPFDSAAHQLLIQVCLRRGRRTEAVRHYSALRMRLARAFGEKPDFDLARIVADTTSIAV